MEESIFIYTIAILIFFFIAERNSRKCRVLISRGGVVQLEKSFFSFASISILLLFFIFCGLRYDVGADYMGYLNSYMNYESQTGVILYQEERGFAFIMTVCYKLGLSPVYFFGISATIQMALLLFAFRKEQYLWSWLILFFFINGGFMLWMNVIRQSLAMCIWMVSLVYLENKKLIPYIICVMLATLFHQSAILLIVLFPLYRFRAKLFGSIPLQFTLILVAFTARVLFSDYFYDISLLYVRLTGGSYSEYLEVLNSYGNYKNTNIVFWFRLIVYCIVIFYSYDLKKFYNSRRFDIIYDLFFIGVLSKCLIPAEMAILTRPFLYFSFFDSIMFAFFVYYLAKAKKQPDRLAMALMIVSFIGVFIGNQIVSNKDSSVWYQFIFNQPINLL